MSSAHKKRNGTSEEVRRAKSYKDFCKLLKHVMKYAGIKRQRDYPTFSESKRYILEGNTP